MLDVRGLCDAQSYAAISNTIVPHDLFTIFFLFFKKSTRLGDVEADIRESSVARLLPVTALATAAALAVAELRTRF